MACGISFFSNNLVDSAVIDLTTGTENAQFPISNIQNESPAKKFRSIENSIVLRFDLQQTRTIDTVAIHGDSNGSLGLTSAAIKTSLTTDFSSSVVTPIPLSSEFLMGYAYIDSVDHRYVELTLTGSGVFAELSNIFIGERIELSQQNLSISSFKYGESDRSVVASNAYGQKFIDKRNRTKSISGNIEYCLKSEQKELDDMFTRHGKSLPMWMVVDKEGAGMIDGEYKLTVYGYLKSRPEWSASGGQTYNCSIDIDRAG